MSKWIVASIVWSVALAAACGGDAGSGVSGSKKLTSLSESEITQLCEYTVSAEGPMRTVMCSGGSTITIGGTTVDECVTDVKDLATGAPNCAATVNDAEACSEAFGDLSDAQLCATPFPAACLPLLQCALGGGG